MRSLGMYVVRGTVCDECVACVLCVLRVCLRVLCVCVCGSTRTTPTHRRANAPQADGGAPLRGRRSMSGARTRRRGALFGLHGVAGIGTAVPSRRPGKAVRLRPAAVAKRRRDSP